MKHRKAVPILRQCCSAAVLPSAVKIDQITHLYHDVTPAEIYDVIQKHLTDIEAFIKDITRFVSTR